MLQRTGFFVFQPVFRDVYEIFGAEVPPQHVSFASVGIRQAIIGSQKTMSDKYYYTCIIVYNNKYY